MAHDIDTERMGDRRESTAPFCDHPISRRAFLQGAAGMAALFGLAGCSQVSGNGSAATELATVLDSAQASKTISLMMVGDMLVHRGVWESGILADGSLNYDHLFTHMASDFADADIALINQETILATDSTANCSGFPLFCSPQQIGDAEAKAGIDAVTCATNHALDQGFAGIESELSFWREKHPEMEVLGIADSEETAQQIHIIERQGVKVAILNYCENTNGIPLPSGKEWCVKLISAADPAADVAAARDAGADFVIIVPHWGTEYVYTPNDFQRSFGQTLADAGADAIIGGHPHVIENVDVLTSADGKQVPCFWSLGNYVSTQGEKPRMLGGMAKLTLEKKGSACKVTEWSMTPIVTHQTRGDQNFGTYKLSDYTEELASSNYIRAYGSTCSDFSRAYVNDLAAQILGEGYDKEACVLKGTL